MTIDINELRKVIADCYWPTSPVTIKELLDRLEAAERDVALKERVIDALGSELNAVAKERDALRAKIKQMEKQRVQLHGGQAMIQLTDINGRAHAIHPDAIARFVEPGTSGKWHGANCYVRTFDGDTIEVRESVLEVMGLIKSAPEAKP